MTQTRVRWTVEDYHRMIEAGILRDRNVELLSGEIHQMAPEGPPHTYYGGSLADRFREHLAGQALVREARPVTLADSEPEPDIAIVRGSWEDYRFRHPMGEEILLLVEISETSLTKDLEVKRGIYAAAGIEDYWIFNLRQPQLIVLRNPHNGDYQSEVRRQEGALSPLAFPDLTLSVDQLLA